MRSLLRSREFWLCAVVLIGVALRSSHFTDPYMIDFHSWRQADSAGFVHGYLVETANPLDPRVDRFPCQFASEPFGQVEAELPLHGYLAALPLLALGIDFPSAPYLRFISLIFFVLACWYLDALARAWGASSREALTAVLVFCLLPVSIFFTRTPQPDGPALMLGTAMLFHLDAFLVRKKGPHALYSALFGAALLLIKISNAFVGIMASVLVLKRVGLAGLLKRPSLLLLGAVMILPAAAWHLHASHFAWTFGIWDVGQGGSKFSNLTLLKDPHTWDVLSGRIQRELLTWPGIALLLIGLRQFRTERVQLAAAWLASVVLFVVVTLRGNLTHVYYQLPVVLPASLLIAAGACDLWRIRWVGPALLAVALGFGVSTMHGTLWGTGGPRYFNPNNGLLEPITLVAKHVPATERFISLNRDPALFYNSGHQGFFVEPNERALGTCIEQSGVRFVLMSREQERLVSRLNVLASKNGRGALVVAGRKGGHAIYRVAAE